MITRASADDISIINGGGNRNSAGRASVDVAQGESKLLERIRREIVLVVKHVIVRRSARPKEASVALQVKVELGRVNYIRVDHRPRRTVAAPILVAGFVGEEPDVMPLSNDNNCDLRWRIDANGEACIFQLRDLLFQNRLKLPLRYAVPKEYDSLGVERGLLLHVLPPFHVHGEDVLGHVLKVLNDLLPRRLHSARRNVFASVGIDVADERCERGTSLRARGRVNDIRAQPE